MLIIIIIIIIIKAHHHQSSVSGSLASFCFVLTLRLSSLVLLLVLLRLCVNSVFSAQVMGGSNAANDDKRRAGGSMGGSMLMPRSGRELMVCVQQHESLSFSTLEKQISETH